MKPILVLIFVALAAFGLNLVKDELAAGQASRDNQKKLAAESLEIPGRAEAVARRQAMDLATTRANEERQRIAEADFRSDAIQKIQAADRREALQQAGAGAP